MNIIKITEGKGSFESRNRNLRDELLVRDIPVNQKVMTGVTMSRLLPCDASSAIFAISEFIGSDV